MPDPNGLILGFDPGGKDKGKGKFGWSICSTDNGNLQPPLETGLATNARNALLQVQQALGRYSPHGDVPVLAAGVDAPMFWSDNGSRTVDDVLRKALRDKQFPTPGGTVQQVNSLRGACLVQGMLVGKYLHETWVLPITEAHPGAMEYLLRYSDQHKVTRMVEHVTAGIANGDQRDATLAAVVAWGMLHQPPGWRDLYPLERHPVQPFDTPVSYWMPI